MELSGESWGDPGNLGPLDPPPDLGLKNLVFIVVRVVDGRWLAAGSGGDCSVGKGSKSM